MKSAVWDQKLTSNNDSIFKNLLKDLQRILCSDPTFWQSIKLIENLLHPLADAILKIENNEVNVRNAFKTVEKAFEISLAVVNKFLTNQIDELKQVRFLKNV